jgi:nitroreductase
MSRDPDPVWQAIARKRAIREFAPRPLAPEHLERILESGRHAGSSKNRQRWTFIVCREREHLRELAAVGRCGSSPAPPWRCLVTRSQLDHGRRSSVRPRLRGEHDAIRLELGIGAYGTVYEPDRRAGYSHCDDRACEYLLSFGCGRLDDLAGRLAGRSSALTEIVREELVGDGCTTAGYCQRNFRAAMASDDHPAGTASRPTAGERRPPTITWPSRPRDRSGG